jgi:succinate dehydrogenase hydrophobic anchor subunit
VGSLLLVVLSLRVAYNHRGAARYTLPQRNPSKPVWWRQQMTGAALFFLAVWFVVGSLRNHLS